MFGTNYSKIGTHKFPELEIDLNRKFVNEFLIKSVFWSVYDNANNSVIFYFLRRIQQIIPLYDEARTNFVEFVESKESPTDSFFNSLNKLEIIITLLCQIYHAYHRLSGKEIFEKNDGSPLCRLNGCYNEIKHLEKEAIIKSEMIFDQTTYLEYDRFCTLNSYVTFQELKDFIIEIAGICDELLKDSNG